MIIQLLELLLKISTTDLMNKNYHIVLHYKHIHCLLKFKINLYDIQLIKQLLTFLIISIIKILNVCHGIYY